MGRNIPSDITHYVISACLSGPRGVFTANAPNHTNTPFQVRRRAKRKPARKSQNSSDGLYIGQGSEASTLQRDGSITFQQERVCCHLHSPAQVASERTGI